MKIKGSLPRENLVLLLFPLVVGIIAFFAFAKSFEDINNANQKTLAALQKLKKNQSNLTKLYKYTGYLGGIHHYKNFVLRRDRVFLERARVSFKKSLEVIEKIDRSSLTDSKDSELLDIISATFSRYYENLEKISKLDSSLSIQDVDKLMRVDDSKAAEALEKLVDNLRFEIGKIEENQIARADKSEKREMTTLILLSLLILGLYLILVFYYLAVTKKKEELERSFKELFESSPDATLIMDLSDGARILDCNAAAMKMVGANDRKEILGSNLKSLSPEFQPDGRLSSEGIRENIEYTLKHGFRRFFWTHQRLNGEEFPAEVVASTINYKGKIVCSVVWRDLTETLSLEKELEHQRKINFHKAKLASIGELAAGVGHEINNPLAIIKGYSDSLVNQFKDKNSLDDESFLSAMDIIDRAIDRITKVTSGLRNFSRMESEATVKFTVDNVIQESVDFVEEIFKKNEVIINCTIEDEVKNQLIIGSPSKLQQVLINLFNNSKDALENSEVKKIDINCVKVGGFIEVSVKDSGKGIPIEIRDKIFDPFFTTKDVNKGTGIGLSLAHRFIIEMDGDLTLEDLSKGESGSLFVIKLPIVSSEEVESTSPENVPQSNGDRPFEDIASLQILIAEDEKELGPILKSILIGLGHRVDVVENGQLAYNLFIENSKSYDLIISDMLMPVMDGVALLKKVRGQSKIAQPKFIFYTGGVTEDLDSADCDFAGLYDAHFLKPFNVESVKASIAKCFKEAS